MVIPCYPQFAPLVLEHKDEMQEALANTPDGVSEFTFADLYLFRRRYLYEVSRLPGAEAAFVLAGSQPVETPPEGAEPGWQMGKKFFLTPMAVPPDDILDDLLHGRDYWKNIPESLLLPNRERLEKKGLEIAEDRDNFDYIYLRSDLASLSGKRFHKKKNLVNAFYNTYFNHEEKPLTREIIGDAIKVLDQWRKDKGDEGDYIASREALEHFEELKMRGMVYYIDGKPVGWCQGEELARGAMFSVHFEKGIDGYKGIYQFINQYFAESLPESIVYINREQDLGDLGLRQAKETYRPCGFVKKYTAVLKRL